MQVPRQRLIREYAKLSEQLRQYGIGRLSDYAELLVAEALEGNRVESGVNKGFDIVAPGFGRIEVKYRQMPSDGRVEHRVQIGSAKCEGFDYLAVIVFDAEMNVQGAVLVPYKSVWEVIESRTWRRISYDQATALPGAINITAQVVAASQHT